VSAHVSSHSMLTLGRCENVDTDHKGRQIGIVFSGVSGAAVLVSPLQHSELGSSAQAPVIGGALYNELGWHAPCIFTMGVCLFDLIARLLVLERNPRKPATEEELSKELSPQRVLLALLRSGRSMTGVMLAFVFGLIMGAKDVAYVV
jgi:predicted MFS family arabinose efflux permease